MVVLRRVKSYSCRSSASVERSQHYALVGKKVTDASVTRRTTTDPPATCDGLAFMSEESYCDIPHVVTIEATLSDDISELRDPCVYEPNTTPRPMSRIPNPKYAYSHNQRTHCLSRVHALVCEDEDWPSDEEGEMTTKCITTSANHGASGLNLCGLGECLIPVVRLEQADNKRDDGTENASSARDMALTCSGSTYANSFARDNSELREDVNLRDDCEPPAAG